MALPIDETIVNLTTTPASSETSSDWDYKLALVVITALAFATRFWGINHPDQVVFDEVHFGKVRNEQNFGSARFPSS